VTSISKRRNKLGGGGFDGGGGVGSGEELQAAAVAGHETFEQGTIHAVKIARGVGDIEQRLQVEMKGGVSERREVDESSLAKGGLQGESEVDGDGGGSAAAFGVDDGKYLAAGTFLCEPGAEP